MDTIKKLALDALQEAVSVCNSVSTAANRRVDRDGCAMFLQTEEWCRWAEDDVQPKLRAAIKALSTPAAVDAPEPAPVALRKAFSLLDRMPINEGYHDEIVETLDALRAAIAASQHAPVEAQAVPTQAARDVLGERQRQISTEGYTPEHDDEHGAEEFGRAASVYANSHVYDVIGASYMGWPWDEAWYKPTTQRRNFVKAAALLLAGIECIDRAAGIAAPPAPQAASGALTMAEGIGKHGVVKQWPDVAASEPASVAGLSGDAGREALTDEQIVKMLEASDWGYAHEFAGQCRVIALDDALNVLRVAIHSTGKPDGEAHNFAQLECITNWLIERGALLTNRTEETDGPLAPALNIIDSIEAIAATADAPVAEPGMTLDQFDAKQEAEVLAWHKGFCLGRESALKAEAPVAEPVALTEKQRRVLEHYNFAQFDADNLAKVPEAVRRDLWAMLDEMSATPQAKDANQCVWPDQAHEAGSHGYCVHCGAALSQGGGA